MRWIYWLYWKWRVWHDVRYIKKFARILKDL